MKSILVLSLFFIFSCNSDYEVKSGNVDEFGNGTSSEFVRSNDNSYFKHRSNSTDGSYSISYTGFNAIILESFNSSGDLATRFYFDLAKGDYVFVDYDQSTVSVANYKEYFDKLKSFANDNNLASLYEDLYDSFDSEIEVINSQNLTIVGNQCEEVHYRVNFSAVVNGTPINGVTTEDKSCWGDSPSQYAAKYNKIIDYWGKNWKYFDDWAEYAEQIPFYSDMVTELNQKVIKGRKFIYSSYYYNQFDSTWSGFEIVEISTDNNFPYDKLNYPSDFTKKELFDFSSGLRARK